MTTQFSDELTLNGAIAFLNQLQTRINELSNLRLQGASRETRSYDGKETVVKEPTYDVKALDKKITELQNWKFRIESKIKEVNSATKLGYIVPVGELLAPIA